MGFNVFFLKEGQVYPVSPSQLSLCSFCLLVPFSLVSLWVCCEEWYCNGVSECLFVFVGGGEGAELLFT